MTPMPNRRKALCQKVTINASKVYLHLGFYDDACTHVGEIFVVVAQTGSYERAVLDEVARSASKRLQLGEPLEELAEDWLGTRFAPCGPVVGDDRIKNCTSILDWVARYCLVNFCGRSDLAHVPAPVPPSEKIMDCGSPP